MSAPLQVLVVIASTRQGRLGPTVAAWFTARAAGRADMRIDLLDLATEGPPRTLAAGHPSRGEYPEAVRPFAARVAACDAVVLVTPEYNHGYPGSLKDALDAVGPEWRAKPVAFVAYGGISGGIRAVEQLRPVVAELHMTSVRESVLITSARRAFADGEPADADGRLADAVTATLDRLGWWGRALRAARAAEPYGGAV